ncbi:anti-sigma-K factor RskA [Kribbella aluminosa]|uniref:Regulator of SigK n=1 Tax=Kribbella aluminosa TaxID=416017 RepID=A0ABS4UWJ3_9ACTN|nr:anti-sigma factor [Kribbella aluminosa]MBP2356028.1 anti-sigma-K factor RskA [Kribbella aluminosa]
MTEPDVHTLAGPYALDALPDTERATFEQHLASCSSCAAEVDELREAAVRLAADVSTRPPAALKANVMAAIGEVRQLPPLVRDSSGNDNAETGTRRVRRRTMLALAAAALAVAASGGIAIDQYHEKSLVAQANDRLTAVLAEPDATAVHKDVDGGGQATVVTSNRADAAVVVLRGLRQLPNNETWQLWLIDQSQVAHSVGLASGDLTRLISGGVKGKVAFGLTVEPAGGSAKPTLPAAALVPMT